MISSTAIRGREMWNRTLFQQRRSEIVRHEPVHNNNHRAARHQTLFDDARIPVAKALLLHFRGDLIRLHRVAMIVSSARKPATAPPTAVARRCPPFVVVRRSSTSLASTVRGRFSTIETRRHHAPRQTRQLARQVVPVADAENAFRRLDASGARP